MGGLINNIVNPFDLVSKYEDEGYYENDEIVIMISDNEFYFRCKITNETCQHKYCKSEDYINIISMCIDKAQEHGFIVK